MIEDRKVNVGMVLAARHKGKEYRCEVVAGGEGRVRYRLKDGREFNTPSGAGSAVMGGVACNGWRFWSLAADGGAMRAETKPAKRTKKQETKSAPALPKTKSQRQVMVGQNGHKPEVRRRGGVRRSR